MLAWLGAETAAGRPLPVGSFSSHSTSLLLPSFPLAHEVRLLVALSLVFLTHSSKLQEICRWCFRVIPSTRETASFERRFH